jgi:hypothetical protein
MNNRLKTESSSTLNQNEDFLQVKYAYGIDISSKNTTTVFISNTTLAYIVGSNLLTLDVESMKQKLIPVKSKGRIEMLRVTNDKKSAILVDIEGKNSVLLILDLTGQDRKRAKTSRTLMNETITSMAISNDAEFIALSVLAGEDTFLKVFSFSQLNSLSEFKLFSKNSDGGVNVSVEDITFFVNDSKRMVLIGHMLIKIMLYTIKGIRLIYNLECDYYLEKYAWLSKSEMIVFDKRGNLFSVEPKQNSIKHIRLNSWNLDEFQGSVLSVNDEIGDFFVSKIDQNCRVLRPASSELIKTLVCARNGFFLSYIKGTSVYFYEKTPSQNDHFVLKFTLKFKDEVGNKNKNKNEFIGKIALKNSAYVNKIN